MHFELAKSYSKTVTIVFAFVLLFVLMDLWFPLPMQKEFSKQIRASDGTLLSAYLTSDDKWRLRTELEEVSPELIRAIVTKEDRWFHWHFGINPVSIVRAFYKNLISGGIEAGASTISMQVARMLEPKERTYINKFAEMFRALQLEVKYSKEEILELYLSMLPFGGNIEGVKSASLIYFNRPPDNLSLAQSIMLGVIPNDPNSLRLDRSNNEVIQKRNSWIDKFKRDEIFPLLDLKDAIDESIEPQRYAVPVSAPHFSYYIKENFYGDIITTTLDLEIQQTAENLLLHNIKKVFYKGITNGAVLVIDNKNSSVVAYCGSADFYDKGSFGQVNGITAIRSPGSTLKAALFAYAFDDGNLTPQMRLADIPTDFHGYHPENYDLKFYGNVSTQFALVNSLNIPAVSLLDQVGLNNFINLLEEIGFSQIQQQKNRLGLSLILGGCGTSLFELTRLFVSFSNRGVLSTINFTLNKEKQDEVQIFSESASYLIAKILSGVERSDIANLSNFSKLPKFAWKTGTSYGKRDAWAVGFNPNYTIGVWLGNFNGVGSPNLSGGEVAVPLLFDLFNAIDFDSDVKWFQVPDELFEREVCSESGLLPSKYCSKVISDFAIVDKSHNISCNLHIPVYVNMEESVQFCTGCLPFSGYKRIVYSVYNPELTAWLDQKGYEFRTPPAHNPFCNSRFTEEGPRIISPSDSYEYLIEENSEQEILLLAASDARVKTHYWYVNDKFYKKCKPGERVFFNPDQKDLKITCLDDRGRDRTIKVSLKFY